MINVKSHVYDGIKEITENVSDLYPTSWTTLPAIQYAEEDNSVVEWTDDREQKAHLLYRIEIWDNRSTSEIALQIDEAMARLGLRRIGCSDTPDPSQLKHKTMRYEGIIDVNNERIFQTEY